MSTPSIELWERPVDRPGAAYTPLYYVGASIYKGGRRGVVLIHVDRVIGRRAYIVRVDS